MTAGARDAPARDVGLCDSCVHCRVIRARRSTFYMCRRSFTDARFPRYPRLPVVRCIGYAPGTPADDDPAGSTDSPPAGS